MMQAARALDLVSRFSSRPLARQTKLIQARGFNTSVARRETFTIQDEDDYQKRVLENTDPVIVDFKANWCGPCKMLTPRLDAAIAATEGKVHLAIVDIDELSDIAMEGGVEAVPTVIAFKDGKQVDRFVGLLDEDRLDAFVQKLIVK